MGEKSQIIREQNIHTREELANDLEALGDKLDVKKQVGHAKENAMDQVHEKIDTVKEKIGMSTSSNPGGHSEVGHIVSVFTKHPIGTIAFLYGAKRMIDAVRETQAQHNRYAGYYAGGSVQGGSSGIKDKASGAVDAVQGTASSAASSVSGAAGQAAGVVSDRASQAASAVSGAASDVADRASGVASSAAGSVADVAGQVRGYLPQDMHQVQVAARNNWTMVGLGGLALGALVGYLTPNTAFENERLVDVKDNLKDQAMDKVDVVRDAAMQAKDDVVEAAIQAKDQVTETVSQVAETARSGAEDAKDTFQEEVKSGVSSGSSSGDTLSGGYTGSSGS